VRFCPYLHNPLAYGYRILSLGFDYHFNAIQNEDNELFNAYKDMFEIAVSQPGSLSNAIMTYAPIIKRLFVRFDLGLAMRC
jgi:hypothetical protein